MRGEGLGGVVGRDEKEDEEREGEEREDEERVNHCRS